MAYFSDTLKNINWVMFISLAVLISFSIVFVGSAAYNAKVERADGQDLRDQKRPGFKEYIYKQCIWVVLGLTAFFLTLRFNYRTFHEYAYVLYAGGVFVLLFLFLLPPVKNTHSWIRIGGVGFQPSELMKIFYVFAMARFLERWETRDRISGLILPICITGVPFVIIVLQPDMGTAAVFLPVMFIMIFMAGVKIKYIVGAIALFFIAVGGGVFASLVLDFEILDDYQKKRITAFLNPEEEKMSVSYQAYQSLAAIGSGGFFGRGIGNGTKTQLDQLPEKHTDFIISVIAEEGGFFAIMILLSAFYTFLFSTFMTAHNAPDQFGQLVVVGIIGILSTQIVVNIGVASSLLPITGITLPLISYGGSSMLVSFIMIGVVMTIGKEKKPYFA